MHRTHPTGNCPSLSVIETLTGRAAAGLECGIIAARLRLVMVGQVAHFQKLQPGAEQLFLSAIKGAVGQADRPRNLMC